MKYIEKINILEIIMKIKFEKIVLKYGETKEYMKQEQTIEITGLIKILLMHIGKYVTLNSLNAYKIKEKELTTNIEIKQQSTPPLGTNMAIKSTAKIPSKMLYFKEAICSPMEFKIPMQISCT